MNGRLEGLGKAQRWWPSTLWGSRRQRLMVLSVALMLALGVVLDQAFPLPPDVLAPSRSLSTLVVVAQDGTPLRTWPSADGVLRQAVPLADVSPHYLQALLTFEDRWYRWHPGVNPLALARAAWQWMRHGRVVSGGSTLTMQVARVLETAAPSNRFLAKAKQMMRALQLEIHLSKDEILTLYLNHAPMGGRVEGVEMASRAYLGKAARDLSAAEAALLVALPQTPSRLRPDRAPAAAQIARDKVLTRMQTWGVWSAAVVRDAKLERVLPPAPAPRWLAPLAAQRLKNEQQSTQRPCTADNPDTGLMCRTSAATLIRSTIDAGVQIRLEQILLDQLPRLPATVSIAALVVDNETLAVRGYAGSANFSDPRRAAHVDMVRAVRSPGSTLKPFLYAMGLDDGLLHSESLLIDAPQNIDGYAPANFQVGFSGPVSVSQALQSSLNVPAVDLLDRLGPARFSAHLRNAGLRLRLPAGAEPNLSLILGGGGTTLEELVGAYTALARGGVAGQVRLTPDAPLVETRLMSEGAAFIVREILENGGRPEAPFRESSTRVAWKTGTSFGFRDAWAIGVTDRYTVGVWVGRPDGTPNPGYFGANTAAPLVKQVLAALAATQETTTQPRRQPAEVTAQDICWPLGWAASQTPARHCLQRRSAWLLKHTAPPTLPDRVRPGSLLETFWVGADQPLRRGRKACANDLSLQAITQVRWPTLLQPWIESQGPAESERFERWALVNSCQPSGGPPRQPGDSAQRTFNGLQHSLRIHGVEPASIVRLSPGRSELSVSVRAIGTYEAVTWLLNGRTMGTSNPRQPSFKLQLKQPGPQALTALDAQGRYESVAFRVQ